MPSPCSQCTVFVLQGFASIFGKGSERKEFQGRICKGISYGDLCLTYDSQGGFGGIHVGGGKGLFCSSLKVIVLNSTVLMAISDESQQLKRA